MALSYVRRQKWLAEINAIAVISRLAEAMGGEASTDQPRLDDKWVGKRAANRTWVHPDAVLKMGKLGL